MVDQVASSLAYRAVAVASSAYMGFMTTACTGVDTASAVGDRAKKPVAAAVGVACWACVAYGTAAGVGADRADMAGGGRKDPVAAVVTVN